MNRQAINLAWIYFSLFCISISVWSCTTTKNMGNLQDGEALEMIDAHEFKFIPQSASPQTGRVRQLTARYDVTVTKDTLISYLPYFGRAYSAPMDPSKGGIQFTSTEFTYEKKEDKSNSWFITIQPKDQPGSQQFFFKIFENGNASLTFTDNNRSTISFNGTIQKIK